MTLQCLDTSYHPDYNLRITAGGNVLRIDRFPNGPAFDHLLVELKDVRGSERLNCFRPERGKGGTCAFTLPTLEDGNYRLEAYDYGSPPVWTGYIYGEDIVMAVRGGAVRFRQPLPYGENKRLLQGLGKDTPFLRECLKSSSRCSSGHPEVRKLARGLTDGETDPYRKALLLHDWVAENIAYDYDSLADGTCGFDSQRPESVLRDGRCVCMGFSDLYVSLLRAAGVPALSRACFALGETTPGGWDIPVNMTSAANHDFSVFYAHGRWVLTDVTWDGNRVWTGGALSARRAWISHKYFDISLALFSGTHRFCN